MKLTVEMLIAATEKVAKQGLTTPEFYASPKELGLSFKALQKSDLFKKTNK